MGSAGYGGVFRNSNGVWVGAFRANAHVASAVEAEVLAGLEAIRVAWVRDWHHVWLETDSFVL